MKTLNEAKVNYLRVTANTREKQRRIGEIEKKTLAFRLDRDSELAQQKIINNVLKERLDMAINEEEKLMYHEKYYERYQNEMGAKLGHVEDGKEEKLMGAEVDPPSGVNTFDEGKGLSGVSPEVDLPGGNVNPQTESEEMKAIPTDVQVPLTSPTVPRAGSWDESAENRRSGGETGEIDGTIQQRIIERPFKELNLVSEKERLERQEEVQQMFGNLEDVEPEGVEQSMESGIDVHSQVHGPDGEEMISRASSVAGVPEGKIESQTELRRMEIPTEDQASLNSQTQFSASSFDEGVMSSYSESEVVDSFRGNQISCFKDSAVPPSVLEAEGGFAKGVGMVTPKVPPSDLHRPTDDDQINMACEKTVLSLKSPLSFEDWSDDGSEEQNIVQTLSLCSSGTYEIPSVQQTSLIACSDTKMQAPESQISQSFERGASHEGRNLETQLVSEINDRRAPIPRMSFADDNYSTILPGSQPMPVGSVGYPEPGKSPRDDILITTQQILESSSDGTSTAVEMASTSINVVLQEKEDIEGEKSQEPPSLESRDQYSDNDLVFEAAGPSEPRVKVSESTINDLNEYESIHVHSPGSEASTEVPELRIIDSDDLEASKAQPPDSPSASHPLGSLEPEMEVCAWKLQFP
ncbi:uncharacterized protein LOC135166460 [Diachasmimorpha longicaudata]|uniref:uncharacterized protein LOC135166460 n=1 Tax=Diachasmimorpha longicaudata TaxID=58733 RepID=UPI0030B8FA66